MLVLNFDNDFAKWRKVLYFQSDKHLDEAIYRNIQTEYDGSPDSQNYFSKHMNAVHTTVSRV